MQVATTPPYNASAHNASIYHNPTFQSPQFQIVSPTNDSAFVSSEHYDDDDYCHINPGPHQPAFTEPDIAFGNEDFDPSAAQFCGVNVANMFVNDNSAYSSPTNCIALPPMADLQSLPVSPPGQTISHWLELCSGSMLAGLTAALAAGIAI